MKTKTYTHEQVTYGFSIQSRKWEFQVGNFNFLCACNGQENAHKVARIVSGSFKRSNSLDGLARTNIKKVVTPKAIEE